jgi:hypothetical protein
MYIKLIFSTSKGADSHPKERKDVGLTLSVKNKNQFFESFLRLKIVSGTDVVAFSQIKQALQFMPPALRSVLIARHTMSGGRLCSIGRPCNQ